MRNMPMRLTGMSSGLDIDKIVSDLMRVERVPQDKLKQKRDLLNFQTNLYREVNTKVATLREALNAMRYTSTMTGTKATSSSLSVSATVNAGTSKSSYSLEVSQLATNATVTGTGGVTNFGLESKVSSGAIIQKGVNDKLVVTVDNQAKMITLNEGTYDLDQLKDEFQSAINSSFGTGKVNVAVDNGKLVVDPVAKAGYKPQVILNEGNRALSELGFTEGQSYRLNTKTKLSDLAASGKLNSGALQESGTFQVNGVDISYTGADSIQDIMTKVNSSSANVTMSYDSKNDAFVFKSRATGSTAEVSLAQSDGNLLSALNVAPTSASGADAVVTIDGVEQSFSSNSFSHDGIAYQLNQVTTEPVTVTVAPDTDAVMTKVKNFVTAYNDLMDLVNTRLSETRDRNYNPLTSEEREALSESESSMWDSKVKAGLLNNSSILKNIKNSLRELLSKTVDGISDEFNTLAAVGITTVPYVRGVPKDAGKITIDETRLANALAKDPDAVSALFANNPGFESQEGIAVTMYKRVDSLMTSLINQAGRGSGSTNDVTTTLGKQINQLESKITAMNSLLDKRENNYFKRFSAMETAIANGNSTLSWLSSQFG